MKFKRGLLIVFLLLAVITIGSVSAADALADAEDGIDSESLSEIESAPISSSESEIIGEADNGTFTALQNKINNAEDGSTITLNNDYVYDDGFDTRGIRIAKSMTIDGNNHVIDAKSQSKIFYSSGTSGVEPEDNIVLKNIKFVGGKAPTSEYLGGAIYNFWGANYKIISCDFKNCYAPKNGAIWSNSGILSLSSCNFLNCSSGMGSGAVHIDCKAIITSCNFTDCHSKNGDGGAIEFFCSENSTVDSCNFLKCSAGNIGGAVCTTECENFIMKSCDFKECSVTRLGGAIFANNLNSKLDSVKNYRIISCDFTDCSAGTGGGAIYISVGDCNMSSCDFINCHFEENITSKEAIASGSELSNIFVEGCTFKDVARPANTTPATVPVKIAASDLSMMYTAGSPFRVTVYGTDGNPANGTSVVIKVNGKTVKTITANANGKATYKPTQAPGSYKISATALGKTVTKKLTVKHLVTLKAVTVKKSAQKLVLQATLGKVNGKYLKGKQVTFKFNGKTYKAKTSSKGVAKVTIKSSVLKKLKVGKKVTYQATYLKDTAKKTAKVLK